MAKEKKRVYPGYMGRAKEAPERPDDHSEIAVKGVQERFDHSGVQPRPEKLDIDPKVARRVAVRGEEDPDEFVGELVGSNPKGRRFGISDLPPDPIDEPEDIRQEAWQDAVASIAVPTGAVPVEEEEVMECYERLRAEAVEFFREPSEEVLTALARQAVLLLANSHLKIDYEPEARNR